MTERASLGELEHLVLATALRLEGGYGDRARIGVWEGLEATLGDA